MSKPIRIQLSRKKGWRLPENTVVVSRRGRGLDWGNPYRVGIDGTAEDCVRKFRAMWLTHTADTRREMLTPLRSKNLACWCPLDAPCHADVLLEIANK